MAKAKCAAAADCHGITSQNNVCKVLYRVTHGTTATLGDYAKWKDIDLSAYTLNEENCIEGKCLGNKK